MDGQKITRRAEKLFHGEERSNTDRGWQLLSEFILPNQSGRFNEQTTSGTRKTTRIYDSTAIQTNHDLAASIHSVLTNPAVKWSKLRFKEADLNSSPEAAKWLSTVNDRIHEAFNESNFNNEIAKNYKMFTALGNMALLHEDQDHIDGGEFKSFRFKAIHLSEIAWSENEKGRVDTAYRRFELTARQAFERWGDKVSDEIKELTERDPERKFTFYHAVFPRAKEDIKLNDSGLGPAKGRPFASIYIQRKAKENDGILEEGGYYEFPYYVVRWETLPGEVYGRGPGHVALPDVRTLNKVKELGLQAMAKAIHPPVLATQRSVLGTLDMRPGRISVVRDLDGIREMPSQAKFDVTNLAVEDLKASIKNIFFLDKLLLPPRPEVKTEMTAFEISQRIEQMQKVLGPTLGRLNNELLEPLVLRAFKILLRSDSLPEMPEILIQRGIDVEITFVNTLARSQKMEDVSNIQTWAQGIAALAQLRPEIVDNIDVDGIARHTAKVLGIPEIAVSEEGEVEEIREQRAQQQQQAQAMEAGVAMADIQSKTGGDNNGS